MEDIMGKMMSDNTTVEYSPIGHVRALLNKTSKLGVDPNTILRKCNLSFTLSDVESGKILCLNRPHFSTIVRTCLLTATDAFSNDSRQIMGRLDFDLMCYGCLQCSTLEEAITRQVDILHLLHDSQGCLELHREGDTAIVEFRTFRAERLCGLPSTIQLADRRGVARRRFQHRIRSFAAVRRKAAVAL
jgi:hypothetical protein